MSPQHPHDQEAWHRFVRRLVLILDAMLADMLAHMTAQTEHLPRWHPQRLAMRRLHRAFTRLRDAWADLPAPECDLRAPRVPTGVDYPRAADDVHHRVVLWGTGRHAPVVPHRRRCSPGVAARLPLGRPRSHAHIVTI